MSLRNVVFCGGPRDEQSTVMSDPSPTITTADRVDNKNQWNEYHCANPSDDILIYEFVQSLEAPISYADLRLDHWIGHQFPSGYRGWMADVGAYDGFTGSNSFYLEELGWKCLCVEPNHNLQSELKLRRAMVAHCAASDHTSDAEILYVHQTCPPAFTSIDDPRKRPIPTGFKFGDIGNQWEEQQVRIRTLDDLLDSYGFPELDVLSIDTEGTELDVLRGCDLERWHPQVIVAEAWDHVHPMVGYLRDRGYRLIERRLVNNLFLHE